MKRSFQEIDNSIVKTVSNVQNLESSLKNTNDLEENLQAQITQLKRFGYANYSDSDVKKKYLRVFARHIFYPQTESDGAHFKVWIEGSIINNKYGHLRFGSFFEQVKVSFLSQTDKKNAVVTTQNCEWKEEDLGSGADAECFVFKLYSDVSKPFIAKISLVKNDEHVKRYELNEKFRDLLPSLRVDPTEEEVLLAVWMYCTDRNLFNEKERKYIKCDEKLKEVLSVDSLLASSLRTKLSKLMTLHKTISFEHYLNNSNTVESLVSAYKQNNSTATSSVVPASAFAVAGTNMRQFDLEVDVINEHSLRYVAELNALTRKEYLLSDELAKYYDEQVYLANSIMSLQKEIDKGREFLAAQKTLVEERTNAFTGSNAAGTATNDMDVEEAASSSPTSVAVVRSSDKIVPTPSSLALEDPVSVYKLLASRSTPHHRTAINNLHKQLMASASGAGASAAAAADDEGVDAKDDVAVGSGAELTNSGSVENLAALNQSQQQLLQQHQATVPVHRYHKTALHVHSGFVDVGDDVSFFTDANSQYLEHLARELLLKEEKDRNNQSVDGPQSTAMDTATSEAMNMMDEM